MSLTVEQGKRGHQRASSFPGTARNCKVSRWNCQQAKGLTNEARWQPRTAPSYRPHQPSSVVALAVLPLAGRRDGSHVWGLAASLASRRALWPNVFRREARAFESDSTLLHHRTSNRPQRSAPRQPLTATAKPPVVKMPKCEFLLLCL